MIEEIKDVGAELELRVFMERKILLKRGIEVIKTRPNHHVATGVSVRKLSRQRKTRRVEPFRGCLRAAVGIADQVGPLRRRRQWLTVIGAIHGEVHREGR